MCRSYKYFGRIKVGYNLKLEIYWLKEGWACTGFRKVLAKGNVRMC
jgi:hypothetical protein